MNPSPAFRSLAAAVAVSLLASCVTTNLPPISSAGEGFEPLDDEVKLWEMSRAEEEKLLAEAALYDDPLLEEYLAGIVERLDPEGMAANRHLDYRVRVLAAPTLNAFAYPHGSIYVHTGLLARMETEDQLATVFGHEMSHVEYRHMLRHRRAAQNRAVALGVASVAAAVVLAHETGDAIEEGEWGRAATIDVFGDLLVGLGLQLAFLAAVNGYGRDLELEADEHGFTRLVDAGYRAGEAPRMYETLMAEAKGDSGKVETFFFGSHPQLTQRVANAEGFVARQRAAAGGAAEEEPAEPPYDESTFHRRLRAVVRDNAALNLEIGRLDLAEKDLARAVEWLPEDPETHRLLARLRLAQAEAGDDDQKLERRGEALAELREAIRLDADLAAAHRDLGLLLYADGDLTAACREFRYYAELAPDAADESRFRDYVRELEADGACP
jgi:predicted Zn-dependent protease